MGKKSAVRKFIDPKKDVLHTFAITKKAPAEPTPDASNPKSAAPKKNKKKVMFQLRCDAEAEENQQVNLLNVPETNNVNLFPELGSVPKNKRTSSDGIGLRTNENDTISDNDQSAITLIEPKIQPVLDQEHNSTQQSSSTEYYDDPNDFSKYGVYYYDGYDYGQHLRDTGTNTWENLDTEMSTVPLEHAQQHKKDRRLQPIVEQGNKEIYCPPPIEEQIMMTIKDDGDSFDDADSEELPDNLIDFLNAEEDVENFKQPIMNMRYDDDSYYGDKYDELAEVDYINMPQLEQFDDELDCTEGVEIDDELDSTKGMESDDNSCGFNLSNLSGLEEGNENNKSSHPMMDQFLETNVLASNGETTDNHSKLDMFFDGVENDFEMDKKESKLLDVPQMESSKGVRKMTRGEELVNDHFNAMMLRDFADEDIGDNRIEDVEGFLPDDAPQFLQAMEKGMNMRMGDEKVALVGPDIEQETKEHEQLRKHAIEYAKLWKPTKTKMYEIDIPNPRAMKYNASNLPTITNKNMPTILTVNINNKKKKGLTRMDLKQHNVDMDTSDKEDDIDAQTYKTALTECSYRPLGETAEERRDRKGALRELRRGRREEKKANQIAHKEMMYMTTKVNMNAKHCQTRSMI